MSSKRRRVGADVRRVEDVPPEHRRELAEKQAAFSERERRRREREAGRAAAIEALQPKPDRRRLARKDAQQDGVVWRASIQQRTERALESAPSLVLDAKEYHAAVLCVERLLRMGISQIGAEAPLSRVEYFVLRREFSWLDGARAYHNSLHWGRVRTGQMAHRHRCEWCGSGHEPGRTVDVHHLHYATVGAERPVIDLVTLCRWCHEDEHGWGADPVIVRVWGEAMRLDVDRRPDEKGDNGDNIPF